MICKLFSPVHIAGITDTPEQLASPLRTSCVLQTRELDFEVHIEDAKELRDMVGGRLFAYVNVKVKPGEEDGRPIILIEGLCENQNQGW